MIDYSFLKDLSKKTGLPYRDLLALSPQNDPSSLLSDLRIQVNGDVFLSEEVRLDQDQNSILSLYSSSLDYADQLSSYRRFKAKEELEGSKLEIEEDINTGLI